MKISMASIYRKFEKEQATLRTQYQSAGMNDEQILEMYEFDKKQLARDIAYYRRTQNIEEIHREINSDSNNKLFHKFLPMLSVPLDENSHSRYWWTEEIGDEALAQKIKELSEREIEILTLLACDDYTQKQAAKILDIPYRTFKYQFAKWFGNTFLY